MKALRFLISIGVVAILWLVIGMGLSSIVSNLIPFQNTTPEDFVKLYRAATTAVAVSTLALIFIWFFYGSREKVILNLGRAKNTWMMLFIISIIASVIQLIYLSIALKDDGVPVLHYLMIYLGTALVSWVSFWVTSYFWSPKNVKYCVLGRK